MNCTKNTFFFLVFYLVIWTSCQTKTPRSEKSPPNVLLIMTDDQGWGDLGFHGNDSIFTPHLDSLATRSIQFDRFFVSPVCAPTRASLLTGRYHLRTGTSWVTHRKEVMRSDETTMAEIFKSNGYRTGIFGKWHNGDQYPNDPKGQGFDEFYGFKAGHWNNYFDSFLFDNGKKVKSEGFIIDALTNKAIDFIKKNSSGENEQPFFCYLPYNTPHSPFQVPDQYFNKYKKMELTDKNACVHGMVENIDDNIDQLITTLKDQQILENTIIIFLTDNGPNGKRYNGNMLGTKGSVHEGGVRVPCFISWKDHLPENKVISQNAAHIDLLPTLSELCELNLPANHFFDGKSLVPLFTSSKSDWEARNIFTIHTEGEMRMKPAAVRTDRYRMVIDFDGNSHLFDMIKDPSQKNDIADSHPLIVDSLKNDLKNWFTDVTKKGITPPLVQVGHPESPTVHFPVPEGKLIGEVLFKGDRGWANDYTINWKKKGDQISWKMNVLEDGKYTFEINYNGSKEFTEVDFSIQVGNQHQNFQIEKMEANNFYESPDRVKRGEVYEKDWAKQTIGIFDLKKGEQEVVIQLANNVPNGWLEIKELEIEKK